MKFKMAATGENNKQISIHVREDSDSELQALFDISLKGGLRPLQGWDTFLSLSLLTLHLYVLSAELGTR